MSCQVQQPGNLGQTNLGGSERGVCLFGLLELTPGLEASGGSTRCQVWSTVTKNATVSEESHTKQERMFNSWANSGFNCPFDPKKYDLLLDESPTVTDAPYECRGSS